MSGRERPRTAGRTALNGLAGSVLYSSGDMVFLLYTRRGCHLCEAAEDMLAACGPAIVAELVDVDADPAIQRRYGDRVPVLTADGAVVLEGRFEEAAVAGLLNGLLTDRASAPGDRGHRQGPRPM